LVLGAIMVAAIAISAASVGLNPQASFARPPAEWIGVFAPVGVALLVWIVVSVGVGSALLWGSVARMWR